MSPEQKDPEQIREEIEESREELGETVEALAEKADVKGQAKAKLDSARAGAQEKVASATESAQRVAGQVSAKAKETTPESVGAGAQQLTTKAQEHPVPVAIVGAFLGGVLVGWILGR
jgi:F0F1-type ATP synthase membrane subunit b/b'